MRVYLTCFYFIYTGKHPSLRSSVFFKKPSSVPLQQHFIPVFFHYFEAAISCQYLFGKAGKRLHLTHLSYHIPLCLSKTKTADAYRFYHTYFYSRSFSKLYRRSKLCGKISSEIYIAFQAAVSIIFLTNFRQGKHSHNMSRCFQTVFQTICRLGTNHLPVTSHYASIRIPPHKKTPGRASLFSSKAFPLSF